MNTQQPDFVSLRPNAVRAHVYRIATRMGCNEEQALQAGQRAVKSIHDGDSAHRAINVGVRLAAEFTGQPIRPLPPRVETLEQKLDIAPALSKIHFVAVALTLAGFALVLLSGNQ